MLRRFLYLDSSALAEYISPIEGGLRTETKSRSVKGSATEGGADIKVARGSHLRNSEEEASTTFVDTDDARFDRLLELANQNPEEAGWINVLDADSHLEGVGIGAMIQWECDVYIPENIRALSSTGEAQEALQLMTEMLPSAKMLGLDTDGVPSVDEMNAMSGLVSNLNAQLIVVGEGDETEWQVAGRLSEDNLRTPDIEGHAIVIGKVSKILKHGMFKPFLTFPGMNLIGRADRRKAERTPPEPGKEDEYLHGPALLLDILAVYR